MLLDFKEVAEGGDDWEAFSRDFLVTLGFAIDSPPNRGADGGKDMIVVEELGGKLGRYAFRWLVSCKHKAHGGKAVSELDEPNILERVESFGCDGFLGIYSTLPTSGLAERLRGLRENRKFRDYRIFDSRLIENHLIRLGYSQLLMRYFPNAYARLKPLHVLFGKYVPLECRLCGRDLLEPVGLENYTGMVGIATSNIKAPNGADQVVDMYWACKGVCDHKLEDRFDRQNCIVGWTDISDLTIPAEYLRWIFAVLNRLHDRDDVYSDKAFDHLKTLLHAMGQKVFRELTAEESQRVKDLLEMPVM